MISHDQLKCSLHTIWDTICEKIGSCDHGQTLSYRIITGQWSWLLFFEWHYMFYCLVNLMCRRDSLMKGNYWLQCRFGCSASGSISKTQNSPTWAQEWRFKLGYVSLLQVQVSPKSGAIKHLIGTTSSKQWAWGQRTTFCMCVRVCVSVMLLMSSSLTIYTNSFNIL